MQFAQSTPSQSAQCDADTMVADTVVDTESAAESDPAEPSRGCGLHMDVEEAIVDSIYDVPPGPATAAESFQWATHFWSALADRGAKLFPQINLALNLRKCSHGWMLGRHRLQWNRWAGICFS